MSENIIREYTAKKDAKKRITLRSAPYAYYHVTEYEDGTILLEPRELIEPTGHSPKKSMIKEERNSASDLIDLSLFR